MPTGILRLEVAQFGVTFGSQLGITEGVVGGPVVAVVVVVVDVSNRRTQLGVRRAG